MHSQGKDIIAGFESALGSMLIQVGGHPGIVQECGQYVLKSALNTETMFYETTYKTSGGSDAKKAMFRAWMPLCYGIAAVSYTHLTLPTNREV